MKKIILPIFLLAILAGCQNQPTSSTTTIVTTSSTSSIAVVSTMSWHDHEAMMQMMASNSSTWMNMEVMNHSDMITSEKSFLINMIPHHQEAIDSSKIILAKTQNEAIKTLAQNIISAQEKEISDMNSWIASLYPGNPDKPSYINMMPDLNPLTSAAADKANLEGMILHHQWAIDMAQKVLTLPHWDNTMNLAQAIISTQNQEISTMKTLLSATK